MTLPELDELTADLYEAIKPQRGVDVHRFVAAEHLLGLPIYRDLDPTRRIVALADDVKEAIMGLPADHRRLLEHYFDLDTSASHAKTLGAKHEAAAALLFANVDDVRQRKLPAALSALAFRLFTVGSGAYSDLLEPLGYEVVAADFRLDLRDPDPTSRQLDMDVTIRLTRADTVMFLWLWRPDEGVRLSGVPMCHSRGHRMVGVVPHIPSRPLADQMLAVYIGDGHPRGYETTIKLTVRSRHPDGVAPDHLAYTPDPGNRHIRLRVDMPVEQAREYRLAIYETAASTTPIPPQKWSRTRKARLTATTEQPQAGLRYVLEWRES